MTNLSMAYDEVNLNFNCIKLRKTELPEQITNIIEYMYVGKYFR